MGSVSGEMVAGGWRPFLIVGFATLLQQFGDQPGPPRLVAGAETCSIIAVEVLVELHQIFPVGVSLEFLDIAVNRPVAALVAQEDAVEAARQFGGNVPQIEHLA